MYKILHASADYFLCSFEFENMETREHIFADYFDDPLYEFFLLSSTWITTTNW
ncbi:MAG: hypothetical protein ACLRYB_17240 [Segatella copri]